MNTQVRFSLLENAMDFLLDAVKQLSEKDLTQVHIKYSALHLASGIGLLLKYRLFREHWSLIFSNIDNANKEALISGDFRSVDFAESIKRLLQICEIDFSNHRPILDKLKKLRNQIEHYAIAIDKFEIISLLVKSWSFVLDYVDIHIDLSDNEKAQNKFDEIRGIMVQHQDFINHRTEEIKSSIEKVKQEDFSIIDCPLCLQDAIPLTGKETECFFCKRSFTADELMNEWLIAKEGWAYVSTKHRSIDPIVYECPECGAYGLYQFPDEYMNPPNPGWICFKCGGSWEYNAIQKCTRCGQYYFIDDDGDPFCGNCI
jgi:hypothetical protein